MLLFGLLLLNKKTGDLPVFGSNKCKSKVILSSFCALSALLAYSAPAYAGDADVLKQLQMMQKQIEMQNAKIESLQEKLQGQSTAVSSAFAADGDVDVESIVEEYLDEYKESQETAVKVGGNMGVTYTDNNKAVGGQTFNPSLEVFFDTRLDDNWSAFFEFAADSIFESNEDETEGEFELERAYVRYTHSDSLNVTAGKFITPYGLYNPEHWLVATDSVSNPIHNENKYIPLANNGIMASGALPFAGSADYNVWVSTGSKSTDTESPNDAGIAYGANIKGNVTENVLLGTSVYTQANHTVTGPNGRFRRETSVSPYFSVDLPHDVRVRGEYLYQNRNENFKDIDAWYADARWNMNDKTYLYYRLDRGDDETGSGASDVRTGHVLAVGYKPIPRVKLKAEYSDVKFSDPATEDYRQWAAYAGLVF